MVDALHAKLPRVGPYLSTRIAESVVRCQREQSLAPDLVLAVLVQESSGRPGARSAAGAIGLMQVMPYMFERARAARQRVARGGQHRGGLPAPGRQHPPPR